ERARKRLAALEEEIFADEERVEELTRELAEPDVYSDGDFVRATLAERDEVRAAIDARYADWEAIAAEIESLERAPRQNRHQTALLGAQGLLRLQEPLHLSRDGAGVRVAAALRRAAPLRAVHASDQRAGRAQHLLGMEGALFVPGRATLGEPARRLPDPR